MTTGVDMADFAQRMHETIDLTDDAEVQKYLQGFQRRGEYFIGIRRHTPTAPNEARGLEIGPKGIETPRRAEFGMHVIYAGTPHHSIHTFGYWHINDVDEVYFRMPSKEPGGEVQQAILMRNPVPGERDMFSWYCQNCVTLLYCSVFHSGDLQLGFQGLWRAEHEAIVAFNKDVKLRTCRNCGTEHPLAYRFWKPHNSPEEEAARAIW